ncbi:hypothetical protein NDU88_007805 [Pleurodeles waltl]|uniref:Metalloendopeptidase n=1 Tax=Pleurodeles waltl TaxID=8319 RepID=A0AAV7U4B0_PLEWA|nr:hypothetical protein NDU88_007805 [Pleurodeles waltl]
MRMKGVFKKRLKTAMCTKGVFKKWLKRGNANERSVQEAAKDGNVYERSVQEVAKERQYTNHLDESKCLGVFEIIIKENEGPSDVAALNEAMLEFATLTCIRFVERTTEADYLQISSGGGCWSYIGKAGGAQQVSLSAGCLTKGPIQHELNHALGFFHEQSRSDRDNYVTIITENIAPEYRPNFKKENSNNLDLQYDYSSIMHYPMYAFSGNNGPTIVPKPNPNTPIGQSDELSNLDIAKINTLYQCERKRLSILETTVISSSPEWLDARSR